MEIPHIRRSKGSRVWGEGGEKVIATFTGTIKRTTLPGSIAFRFFLSVLFSLVFMTSAFVVSASHNFKGCSPEGDNPLCSNRGPGLRLEGAETRINGRGRNRDVAPVLSDPAVAKVALKYCTKPALNKFSTLVLFVNLSVSTF